MTASAKVIEKLKQGFQDQFLGPEIKQPEEEKMDSSYEAMPYFMNYLTPAMIEEATRDLNETEETREKALVELRQLVESEPNLVSRTDENFLQMFLRSRKFNVKKAFKLLQNFWAFRKEHSAIYETINTEFLQQLILRNFMGFLTSRDCNGSIVFIMKFSKWNPEIDTYEQLFRAFSAVLVHSIEDPATQVAGYTAILDVRGLSWPQLKFLTPHNVLLLVKSTQHCFPARYKRIHILSGNKLFNLGWAMVSPFLPKKIKKRILLYGDDLSPLLEYIHPSVLPVEFGGEHEPFDNSVWVDVIEREKDTVMQMLNYGYK